MPYPLFEAAPALAISPTLYLALVLAAVALLLFFIFRAPKGALRLLTYAYLLRFSLLTAAALVALPLSVVFSDPARSLLGNLFDVPWPLGVALVSFMAFLCAWVVMVTWLTTSRNADERFHLQNFIDPFVVTQVAGPRQVFLFGLLAVPLVVVAVWFTGVFNDPHYGRTSINKWRLAAEAVAGLGAAVGVLWLTGRFVTGAGLDRRAVGLFRGVRESYGRGYFDYARAEAGAEAEVAGVRPGHGLALAMTGVTLVFYVLTGVLKFIFLGRDPWLPTLGYVLMLLMLLCWALSGIAFFFDRFRVPVVVPLTLILALTSLLPWSDFYYPVRPRTQPPPWQIAPAPAVIAAPAAAPAAPSTTPTPPTTSTTPTTAAGAPAANAASTPAVGAAGGATQARGREPLIVVAANGGGIQAAAWTARVLTGLQREFGDAFGKRLRVVSSVSGGSVGAMYFVNEYDEEGRPPSGEELERIVRRAEGSSLDEIAWGLVYPDIIRLLTSYGSEWDRGRALEWALRREDQGADWGRRERIEDGLGVWAAEVAAGRRPGSIFNTTVSDTGERLPLSTVRLPPGSEGQGTQQKLFAEIGAANDIPVVTAARLSATFPYVSPAARASIRYDRPAAHLVDGGYYDNYGISSLVEWLNHELANDPRYGRVLFVQIRGSQTRGDYKFESKRGWFYQAFAPLGTLLHVRDTGQLSHNRIELALLIDLWKNRPGGAVQITDVVFEFTGADPPLSWHLNEEEKLAIDMSWTLELLGNEEGVRKAQRSMTDPNKRGLDIVRDFLAQADGG